MKRILLAGLFILSSVVCFSQRYGNEWINYSQQYFKIKVWQNGIYRINRTQLVFSGVPLSTIDPRKLQLFHNGQQEHIFIAGENDGSFDNNDFLEFYGEKNKIGRAHV